MKGCLKPATPVLGSPARTRSPSPSTPSSGSCRHVVFCPHDPIVYFADEWDRTPTEPARKLSYQEILELKAIQRSLPHANQLPDPLARRPFQSQFLTKVPIGLLPLLSETDHSTSRPPSTPTDESATPANTPSPNGYFGVGVQNAFGASYTGKGHHAHTSTNTPSTSASAVICSNLPPPFRPPPNPVECWSPDSERWNSSQTSSPASPNSSATPSPRSWTPQRAFPPPPSFSSSNAPAHLSHLYPPAPKPPRQKPSFSFVTLLDSPTPSEPGTGTNTPGSSCPSPASVFDSRTTSLSDLDLLILPAPSLNNPTPSTVPLIGPPGSAPASPPPAINPDVLPTFKRRNPSAGNPPPYFPPFPVAVSLSPLSKAGKDEPVITIQQPKPINLRLKALASPTLLPPSPLILNNTEGEDNVARTSPNVLNDTPKFTRQQQPPVNAVASSSRLAPPLPLTGRELRERENGKDKFAAAKSRARPNPKRTELMMINDELVEIEVELSDVSDISGSDVSDIEEKQVKQERKKKKEYMMINDEVVVVELDEYESDEEVESKTPTTNTPDLHAVEADTALSIPQTKTQVSSDPNRNYPPTTCAAYASAYAARESIGWVGGV